MSDIDIKIGIDLSFNENEVGVHDEAYTIDLIKGLVISEIRSSLSKVLNRSYDKEILNGFIIDFDKGK